MALNHISKKKAFYPINKGLRAYLKKYGRNSSLPLQYDDLLRYDDSFPVLNKKGEDTLWEGVIYPQYMITELNQRLVEIYSLLKTDGDIKVHEHLYIDRIDYCTFGNSHPFRIRIVNQFNDNYDYFYVKKADASRVYGLELEHILSPNRINYLVHDQTLIEEHIAGIPGDIFITKYIAEPPETLNKVRVAKEFVKFNERCFVRLLGDMRSYNYVVDITPDFEDEQYRVRAIDFDQQSYEGKRTIYLPQFFKENNPIVYLCTSLLDTHTFEQYQREERTLMAKRYHSAKERIGDLLDVIQEDTISTPEKVTQLSSDLAKYHKDKEFKNCKTMGEIVKLHLDSCLKKHH